MYAVGFNMKNAQNDKYFHVKLGPKTIIGGYENLYGKPAEFTYKALSHIDAFGLRKSYTKELFEDCKEF